MSHNALKQIRLQLGREQSAGFSISGLATYVQFAELDLCFDMGECPLSAVPLNHVFLTHAHGDHSRCLMRHYSLRRMLGIEKEAVYILPHSIIPAAEAWIKAEAIFEGVAPHRVEIPRIIGAIASDKFQSLPHRKDIMFRAFEVEHSVTSLGYTLYNYKKKLKPEFNGLSGSEIVALKKQGIEIQYEVHEPRITFIGDCRGNSLFTNSHIWKSPVLFLEATFLEDGEEDMARYKGHTHIKEIARALQTFESEITCEHIVLKHFSMKYVKEEIHRLIKQNIPERFMDRIRVMV